MRLALRQVVLTMRAKYPFETAAWVLLPDYMHIIWQLPRHDDDFSERIRQMKRHSQYVIGHHGKLWQNRFWEHVIRDETDSIQHFDYIHFNPAKHGYVTQVSDWQFSTFHSYVKSEIYPQNRDI